MLLLLSIARPVVQDGRETIPKVPSVTFKGPAGNVRTIKVQQPEKLKGVQVGDTVDITYAESIAISVEKAKK